MKRYRLIALLALSIAPLFTCSAAPLKKALIFGVTGQDGAYLAEFLLEKGYEVHGVRRRASVNNVQRLEGLINSYSQKEERFFVHYGDLSDDSSIHTLIRTIEPDEIYNLAAQSHVQVSFEMPLYTAEVNAVGTLRILEGIRLSGRKEKIKFYHASTSELFGKVREIPQTENTPFYPRSPYGVAKLFAYWSVVNYREAYGLFACNGILFNHESPLREETFVTRKIVLGACQYKQDHQTVLYLGNLDAKRDWGYAKDYVAAMWLMLQQEHPDDYVIASGETHSVREFVETAYSELGIEIEWKGSGKEEVGIDKSNGNIIVRVNPNFYRPTEVDILVGSPLKAMKELKWTPGVSFKELVKMMVLADLKP